MSIVRNYEEVKNGLLSHGFILDVEEQDYKGVTLTPLYCHDNNGYKYKITYDSVMRGKSSKPICTLNPFSIYNINIYLKNNNMHFECIETEYKSKKQILRFRCTNCNTIIEKKWDDMRMIKGQNVFSRKICPNCDNSTESLHASVLKQMFLHEYDGTVLEDKSFVSEETNKVRPTDIVNHNLKIAIEIQSQWHDYEDIQRKDAQKMMYWINKGYRFYSPDIRDFTVLELCQLFFDIEELPNYIDYHYSDGVNAKEIQTLLDKGYNAKEISLLTNVSMHQIYDAVISGKLKYPIDYQRADQAAILQFTLEGEFICEYPTIQSAADSNVDIKAKSLASVLRSGRTKYKGYNWKYKHPERLELRRKRK